MFAVVFLPRIMAIFFYFVEICDFRLAQNGCFRPALTTYGFSTKFMLYYN